MKRILWILALLGGVLCIHGQELRCTVTINSDQVQGTNKEVFNTLTADAVMKIFSAWSEASQESQGVSPGES